MLRFADAARVAPDSIWHVNLSDPILRREVLRTKLRRVVSRRVATPDASSA